MSDELILNATQHNVTKDQVIAGVVDLDFDTHRQVRNLLTFTRPPTVSEMKERAICIAEILNHAMYDINMSRRVMIGGAPFFMRHLEDALYEVDMVPIYAFSQRVIKQTIVGDKVVEVPIFMHEGFVRGGL